MSRKQYLVREMYLRKLRSNKDDHDFVKVITGIRRAGKTILMELFHKELLDSGVPTDRIVFTRMASMEMYDRRGSKEYTDYVYQRLPRDINTYLFIDEVQNITDWEMVIDAVMVDRPLCDIYITGSNAFLLSGELSTHLTGRFVEIHVQPLSFAEYAAMNSPVQDIYELFRMYRRNGSFPAIDSGWDEQSVMDHLDALYNTIVVKDIMERSDRTMSVFRLKRIIEYLMESTGKLVSVNNIASKVKLSNGTVESYLQLIIDCFLLYPVCGYDVKGKMVLDKPFKYYCNDLGLRNVAIGFRNGDLGSKLETLVFLELKRRGYTVYVGRYISAEIDFVARIGSRMEYYQVTETYKDPQVAKREFAPLIALKDAYPKYLITGDAINEDNRDGVVIKNIVSWLMEAQVGGTLTDL